jgi:heme oxygenase
LLRDRLRGATAREHAALDALVTPPHLETPSGYRAFLQASARALVPLELSLEAAGVSGWLPDWPSRARRHALQRDLLDLGIVDPIRPVLDVPPARDFSVGVLYVLEGSRLGGRVLSRQVRAADAQAPVAYLTHGLEQNLWRSFLIWLDSSAKVDFRTDAVEAGARYGFRCFSQAFESLVPPTGGLNVRGCAHVRV